MYLSIILFVSLLSPLVSCGKIGALHSLTTTTETPNIKMTRENIEPSVSEDHVKVLQIEKGGNLYDSKSKGKPNYFRQHVNKLHTANQTDFNENETTTKLSAEVTSHSNVHEQTATSKTAAHETQTTKAVSTTEVPISTTHHHHHHKISKRSFSKDEMESFSEMAKVFSQSFKRFNEDAEKAQKDFMGFMKKLDDMSAAHDKHWE